MKKINTEDLETENMFTIYDGKYNSKIMKISDYDLQDHINSIFQFSYYRSDSIPLSKLTQNLDYIEKLLDESISSFKPNLKQESKRLYDYLKDQYEKIKKIKENYFINGKLSDFSDIEFVFSENDNVIFKDDLNFPRGGIIKSVDRRESRSDIYYVFTIKTLTFIDDAYKFTTYTTYIFKKENYEDLKVKFCSGEQKKLLEERGKKYYKLMSDVDKCKNYNAVANTISWHGLTRSNVRSKIIIDQTFHDKLNQYGKSFDSINLGIESDSDEIINVEEFAWMLPSVIKGISLYDKSPYLFDIEKIEEATWHTEVFDQLKIEDKYKKILMSCVNNYKSISKDLIDSKNDGLIILLNGNPGNGKTLTAEAVSEITKKPLYKISIGDLGTNPSLLEENLREILQRAEFWNAILLIDEADVFLEKRSSDNLAQNWLVSIFLRLLEYFPGILFLTTNRVKNIDPAFLSRITIPINYEDLDLKKKFEIVKNLLQAQNVDYFIDSEISALAENPLNGRQFKSVIKTAVLIAKSENRKITEKDLKDCISLHSSFEKLLQ